MRSDHPFRRKSDSPIWSVLKLAIVCVPLSIFLWKNASKPDWTEIRTVLDTFGVLGGAETVRQAVMRYRSRRYYRVRYQGPFEGNEER